MNRTLYHTVLITKNPKDGIDTGFYLNYYALENESKGAARHAISAICYGVQIEKRSAEAYEVLDSYSAENLELSSATICQLLDLLCENTVTPVTLPDILEDRQGDGDFLFSVV